MTAQPLLDVGDLTEEFATRLGIVKAVQHVNISVAKGETLGIVGESGSGKSVTSYAVMRILDRAGKIAEGSVMFSGIDVKAASENAMRDLRGREISMIFQNPRAALNPIRKVGDQIEDVLRQHVQAAASDRGEKAIEALEQVKIARPRERYHAYPFELSGGMCQRVVIALALACNPQLLIADEPTTGLDVTTQKAVMELIVELTKRRGMSTILITHDLGLAAAYCDRVVVMEKGRVVETALSADIFARPEHPYTRKLMRATPRLGASLRDLLPEEEAALSPSNGVMAGLGPHIHLSSQEHPDGIPGSDRQPQSALYRRARDRRSDHAARQRQGTRRVARPLRGIGGPGRAADQSARSLPASIVGRTKGPRRHRARHRAASEARDSRRADRGARCFRAGGGLESLARSQAIDGHELSVRVARFECGASVVRSCHCDVRRANRRTGSVRARVGRPAGCLYKGAADGDSTSAVAGLVV